jgi:hypothetical protein
MIIKNILNPRTPKEFGEACGSVLRRAPDTVVFGGTSQWTDDARIMEQTGHSVYLENARITPPLLKIQSVRLQSPARYEYYRKLLTDHPGAKLPRSKAVKPKNVGRLVAINMPSSE